MLADLSGSHRFLISAPLPESQDHPSLQTYGRQRHQNGSTYYQFDCSVYYRRSSRFHLEISGPCALEEGALLLHQMSPCDRCESSLLELSVVVRVL